MSLHLLHPTSLVHKIKNRVCVDLCRWNLTQRSVHALARALVSLMCWWDRFSGPLPVSAEESRGVVLQRATDKLIHLLTLLTRPSDFVKLTIDQAYALFCSSPSLTHTHTHRPDLSQTPSFALLFYSPLASTAPFLRFAIGTNGL